MMETWPALIALGLCLMLSFTLSGMEAGVFALNRLRIRRLARAGNAEAKCLHSFLDKPERFLWTILVGNTLVNFLVLGWFVARLHLWLAGHPVQIVVSFIGIVFVFYSFFDLLPKMLFRAYPNRLCLACANVLRFANVGLSPLVLLVERISRLSLRWAGSPSFTGRLFGNREEMRAVMAEAAQALTTEEHTMVNRVLDLQNFTVAQIAVPMAKTYSVEANEPLSKAMSLAREHNLSRLPVWEKRDRRKRVAGLVDISALLYQENPDLNRSVSEFMSPALFLDEGTRLEIALRRMQRAGQRLAVVLGPDGTESGVVALEDILKLMFGEVKL